MHEIKLIRLKTGEDIIAGYELKKQEVVLHNPMHLIFRRRTEGAVMMLMPWLPIELICDNIITLPSKFVLLTVSLKEPIMEYYNNVINGDDYKIMLTDKTIMQNLTTLNQNRDDEDYDDDEEYDDEEYDDEDYDDDDEFEIVFEDEMNITDDINEALQQKKDKKIH